MPNLPKSYPQPNPAVAGSTSRFTTGFFTETDLSGVTIQREKLAAAEPECPLTTFEYNAVSRTGFFRPVLDKNGTAIYVKSRPIPPYIPSQEIRELVRLAQILQRPVLIKGEPGSGKTQLARAVAYEWYGADYKNHFFEWPVKSTSKALDGLYTFDHIARLRDAQLQRNNDTPAPEIDVRIYRTFGPMGKAFLTSTAEAPAILLIDEIDKADIDFPNDLLLELDERRFTIPASETGETIEARYPPLIFITSNDERELPEAFLRRCLFMYIKFPDDEQLKEIIRAHVPGLLEEYAATVILTTEDHKASPVTFVDMAIRRFNRLREEIAKDPSDNKRVSTSELLDWLQGFYFDLEHPSAAGTGEIKEWTETFKKQQPTGLDKAFVNKGLENLPFYYQALLKTYASVNRKEQALSKPA